LPPTTSGCQTHGIDESLVRGRIDSLLHAWKVNKRDVGLEGVLLKTYLETMHGTSDASGAAPGGSQGPLGTTAQLENNFQKLYNQGFRYILDVHVICSRSPEGRNLSSITVVRATVPELDRESNEAGPVEFRPATEVVNDASLLNEATARAMARVWDQPSVLIDRPGPELSVGQPFRARVEVTDGAVAADAVELRARIYRVADGSDLCDRIAAWNELRGGSRLGSLPASRDARKLTVGESRESGVEQELGGPGTYAFRVSLLDDGAGADKALDLGRDVFRCVRVVPPRVIVSLSYVPPSWLAPGDLNFDDTPGHDTRSEWLLFGHVGPASGIGAAFGTSHRIRRGTESNNWDSTADISKATVAGAVPWDLSVLSVYGGVDLGMRHYFFPWLAIDLRIAGMLRLDIVDRSDIPASLSTNSKTTGVPIDFTVVGTAAVTLIPPWFNWSVHGFVLAGAPRTSAFFLRPDPLVRRSIYYDPNYLWLAPGVGLDYAWQ
jgi:hypothetical protein